MLATLLASLAGGLCLLLLGLVLHGAWAYGRAWRAERRARPLSLRITARQELSEQLFALTLALPRRGRLPAFVPGQYLTLMAAAGEGGSLALRCYSLAAWARRPHLYELCIKREDEGLVSRFLHAQLQPGSHIRSLPPKGRFQLQPPKAADAVVLMAGGVGITPMRAMLHALLARHGRTSVYLFQAARFEGELAYRAEFEALAARHPQFHYQPLLSRPGADWAGWSGRLSAERVLGLLGQTPAVFYQCAAAEFMAAMRAGLVAAGVADKRIHEEAFGVSGSGTEAQSVWLDEASYAYTGEPSLLRALNAQGAAVPAECQAGHCGSCRLRLCEGEVRWQAPAACTVAADEVLACVCVPLTPLILAKP